ncbi:MAG: hypothetical protein H0U53_11155 [Actinobacteria bacterium]|nr:hypothetical protein [Actinomycetota bacterium]
MAVDPTPGQKVQAKRQAKARAKAKTQVQAGGRGPRIPGGFEIKFDPKGAPRVVGTDPISQAVEATRPEAKAKQKKANAETLRRQKLLVSLDYKIVVDGIWGPRSQKAWNDYKTRRKTGKTLDFGKGPLKPEKGPKIVVAEVESKQQTALANDPVAPYFLQVADAEEVAAKQRKDYRKEVLTRADKLRINPVLAQDMTFHQIASVVTDDEAKLSITTPKGARIFQEWAIANKVKGVRRTGRYDQQTHDALKREWQKADIAEAQKRARMISTRLYGPAGVKPGDIVDWLPYSKKVPTPQEMDKILQGESGFQASAMLTAFLKRAQSSNAVFDSWRRKQLLLTSAKLGLGVIGKGAQPYWLVGSGSTDGNMLQVYMELLGAQHLLAPTGDFGGMNLRGQALQQERVMRNKKWLVENGRRVSELHAQTLALAHSATPEEFSAKLAFNVKKAEQDWENFQKKLAGNSSSWWGDAIDKAIAPGKFVRTALVYDVMRGSQIVADIVPGGNSGPKVQWEDALATLGDAPDEYDGLATKATGWTRYPFEFAVDPLNFIHPFRSAATLMRLSRVSTTAGRYTLVGQSSRLSKALGPRLAGWDKAIVYEKGTWSKLDKLGRVDAVLLGGRTTNFFNDPVVHRAVAVASRSVQLRSAMFDKTRSMVNLYVVNSFARPRSIPVNAKGFIEDFDVRVPKNKKTLRLIEMGSKEVAPWLQNDPYQAKLLHTLYSEMQSLWVNFDKTRGLSNVGASLRANLIEKMRIQETHKIATSEAYRVYKEGMDAAEGALPQISPEMKRARAEGLMPDDPANVATRVSDEERERIAEAAYDAYRDIVEGSGNFLQGGFLSKGGSADKRLMQRIELAQAENTRAIDETILPQIQNLLEEKAEREGLSMWDDAGLWAGRSGKAANTIRQLGRESFESGMKSVDNPQFGIKFARGEAMELIQAEIGRATGRLYQYRARQAGADVAGKFDLDAQVAEEQKRVEAAWEKQGDAWIDTRAQVEVSDLYVRHLNQAYYTDEAGKMFYRGRAKDPTGTDEGSYFERLKALADAPGNVKGSDFDDGMWDLAWTMTGGYSQRLPGRTLHHGTRRFDGVDDTGMAPDEIPYEIAKDAAYRKKLTDGVATHQKGVSRAIDELLPKEMAKELALWQALAHSQSWYAQVVYKGLKGSLNLWTFSTLALRPGWMVRNVIDNIAKLIVQGVNDPRYFFLGGEKPGAMIASIFDFGLVEIRTMAKFLDDIAGSNVSEHWMKLENMIWSHGSDVLQSIFKAHGIHVPQSILDDARFDPFERSTRGERRLLKEQREIEAGLRQAPTKLEALDRVASDKISASIMSFREHAFELMGNRPENYFKRVLYRAETDASRKRHLSSGKFLRAVEGSDEQVLDEVALERVVHDDAWKKVEDTLFDYSKISVLEDNFRIFFPFIQFWRKNSKFWAESFVSKPWLPLSVVKADDARREAHKDLPGWMRRYVHVEEVLDASAKVPGLEPIMRAILPDDTQYDPFNLLSFAPFYRSLPKLLDFAGEQVGMEAGLEDRLKTENANLPGEKEGWKIVGPFLDMLQDWGLGMSPFARKPAEAAGIATERSWQFMFPQTGPMVALTRQFWGEQAALNVAGWESFWGRLPLGVDSNSIAENFEYYVQQEVANQASRGQPLDKKEAEKVIRLWFLTKEVFAYGTGLYLRRATPEDMYLSQLAELQYQDVPDDQKQAILLWKKRGHDRLTFERYLTMIPLIEAYYRADDWQTKVKLKRENPELTQYVDATFRGKPFSGKWLQNSQRYMQEGIFFQALDITKGIDAPHDVEQAALSVFKTPGMEKYWKENETPADDRRTLIRAAAYEYQSELTAGYFEIPDDDFEAKKGYIQEHPEMTREWARNNDAGDDYELIVGGANRALREIYFGIVKDNTTPGENGEAAGFKAAAGFLKEFRFMFEDTKSAGKIDLETGAWKFSPGKGGGGRDGKKMSPEQRADYLAAKDSLAMFFDQLVPRVGFDAAWDWLDASANTEAGRAIRNYFDKWGGKGGKGGKGGGGSKMSPAQRKDYLAAKPHLDMFFKQLVPRIGIKAAWKWLDDNSDTPAARQIRNYLDKWGKQPANFSPERLHALRQVKPFMGWFFGTYMKNVGEKRAWAWLGKAEGPDALALKDYLKKYGKHSKKSVAYLRAQPWLVLYHDMDEDSRRKWIDGGSEGAKIVQDYFDKWAAPTGNSQHAKDFRATAESRKYYFSLSREEKKAYMEAGSPDAVALLRFFKVYGKTARLERKFMKAFPQLKGGTPEQQKRMEFWRQYFELDPDKRPSFVHKYAESFGVFIYGEFGEQENHDREQEYLRRAVGLGLNERQTAYLYAQPLLDFYYKLPKEDRALFSRLNPELEHYLNTYSSGSASGDKNLDGSIEQYFKLPPESIARAEFLREHPEVQTWFNSKSSPAEKAIRTILDQYFRLSGVERDEFVSKHPEIPAYFEQRRAEKSLTGETYDAFDNSDPRLRPYLSEADDLIRAATEMRRRLREQALAQFRPDTIEARRDRHETTPYL